MKDLKVGVLGIGEVGAAVSAILKEKYAVFNKDLNFDEIGNQKIDVLHICIGYSKKFKKIVNKEVKKIKPHLVIIHSTVAVGTTKAIHDETGVLVAHSPVMGLHPNLKDDIKRFVKYVGGVNEQAALEAKKHLKSVGIKVELMNKPEETELGKLLDTTYYGWNIIFCKLVGNLCNDLDLEFGNVYTRFNQTYNKGYKKIKSHVVRPVLVHKHDRDNGQGIGGHCVMENANILHSNYKTPITNLLIKENENLKKATKKRK